MKDINIKLFEEFKADLDQDKYFAAERINQAVALILEKLQTQGYNKYSEISSFSFDTKNGKMFVVYSDTYDEIDEDGKYFITKFEIDFHADHFQEHFECTIDNPVSGDDKWYNIEEKEYSIVYDESDDDDIVDITPSDICDDNLIKMSKAFFNLR